MDPKAPWKRADNDIEWIASVGPFCLSVVPCNALYCNRPSEHRGSCRILLESSGDIVWQHRYSGMLDLPDLMRAAEDEFHRRLGLLANYDWGSVSKAEPSFELEDQHALLRSAWSKDLEIPSPCAPQPYSGYAVAKAAKEEQFARVVGTVSELTRKRWEWSKVLCGSFAHGQAFEQPVTALSTRIQ